MPNLNQPNIEEVLLRNLTAAAGGDERAIERVCGALKEVEGAAHAELIPVLRSILAIEDPAMRIHASMALGTLGELAGPAVPDLVRLSKAGSGGSSEAALCALGTIPGRESLEGLVEAF